MIFNVILVIFLTAGGSKVYVTQEEFSSRAQCLAQTNALVTSVVERTQGHIRQVIYDCKPFIQFSM